MFAYILRVQSRATPQTDAFFKQFKETPGLLHAYSIQAADDSEDSGVVAIWESREAAERYLSESQLRQNVDRSVTGVTRTMYEVRDSK